MLYIYKKNKQNMGFKSNFLFSTSFIVFLFTLMFPINGLYASSTLKGMQLGDSDAPVKIIEYRSLTLAVIAQTLVMTPLQKLKKIISIKVK